MIAGQYFRTAACRGGKAVGTLSRTEREGERERERKRGREGGEERQTDRREAQAGDQFFACFGTGVWGGRRKPVQICRVGF